MSTVSVIVPVYNTEKFLPECLSSILAQTHREIELICIDDASTDNSLGVLRTFAEQDCRMNVIAAKQHGNAATARNLGIEQSTGDYLCFVDSDDWIDADYIETMLNAAIESKADIVLNTNVIKPERFPVTQFENNNIPKYLNTSEAIYQTVDTLPFRLYRRDFFVRHGLRVPNLDATEDLAFHYISHIHADGIYMFCGSAYHYRSRPGSLTGTLLKDDRRENFAIHAYAAVFEYCIRRCPDVLGSVKMFRIVPSYTVNTEEKFDVFKQFFINLDKAGYAPEKPLYNDLEIFFFHSVLAAGTYAKYRAHHNANVFMSFLKRPKAFRS